MINKDLFKLSVVIPCYNEKQTVIKIIQEVRKSIKNNNIDKYEIIIVDDFSSDGTLELLKSIENSINALASFYLAHLLELAKQWVIEHWARDIGKNKVNFLIRC